MRVLWLFSLFLSVSLFSCRKKPDPVVIVPDEPALVSVKFENMVGNQPLVLNSATYTNQNGDTFTVKTYKYYISNVRLINENGAEFTEPESYHLINHGKPATKEFVIHGMPEGNYTKISFLIGVDSVRNISGAQAGALDPANGMFWDWSTGYIMAMLEGSSNQSKYNNIGFHIVGFEGQHSALRKVTLSFPSTLVVAKNKQPGIHITSDVSEWFKEPNKISFKETPFIAEVGPHSAGVADNYADMFKVSHLD